MRDLSAHEKHEIQKLQKDLEEKKQENGELRKTTEKQQSKVTELEGLIAELHEQVREHPSYRIAYILILIILHNYWENNPFVRVRVDQRIIYSVDSIRTGQR